jgi:predicted aspartyl protease
MSQPFDGQQGLILVAAEVIGPAGTGRLTLALDTGATQTLINTSLLVALGYDPAMSTERLKVTTGSGVEFAPLLSVQRLTALGQSRINLPVLAHTLPPTAKVDGLLGLNFLRETTLTIDFKAGSLRLDP